MRHCDRRFERSFVSNRCNGSKRDNLLRSGSNVERERKRHTLQTTWKNSSLCCSMNRYLTPLWTAFQCKCLIRGLRSPVIAHKPITLASCLKHTHTHTHGAPVEQSRAAAIKAESNLQLIDPKTYLLEITKAAHVLDLLTRCLLRFNCNYWKDHKFCIQMRTNAGADLKYWTEWNNHPPTRTDYAVKHEILSYSLLLSRNTLVRKSYNPRSVQKGAMRKKRV